MCLLPLLHPLHTLHTTPYTPHHNAHCAALHRTTTRTAPHTTPHRTAPPWAQVREVGGLSLESLLPGSLVTARVTGVMRDGLAASFLTFFTATIDPFHLGAPVKGFSVGQKLRVGGGWGGGVGEAVPGAGSFGITM